MRSTFARLDRSFVSVAEKSILRNGTMHAADDASLERDRDVVGAKSYHGLSSDVVPPAEDEDEDE